MQQCPSRYRPADATAKGAAVKRRERLIHSEYQAHARLADLRFNGCGARTVTECRERQCGCVDEVGPIRTELNRHKLVGFAFGGYGEASPAVHTLVKRLADAGAHAWMHRLPSGSRSGAHGRLAWFMKRRIGITVLSGLAHTVLDRIQHVGSGATQRANRGTAARARGLSGPWTHDEARREHDRANQCDHTRDGATGAGFWNDFD